MNRRLRRRHRFAWTAMAVLMPCMLLCAWLVIPLLEPVKAVTLSQPPALPLVLKTVRRPCYDIRLQTDGLGRFQLEWWSGVALRVPSAVIYQLLDGGERVLIGRVETRGHYRFALPMEHASQRLRFEVYDFIHEQVVDTVNVSR